MTYLRGYKLYEPLDILNPNPSSDRLIVTFIEGSDYQSTDGSIIFTETTVNSTYLNGGETEYRYFVAFDDENIGLPSNIFSILNLMPPTNVTAYATEYDEVQTEFTIAEFASGYKYSLKDLSTGEIVVSDLSSDGSIFGLKANSTYEIKLASINDDDEVTEWSNSIQVATLKLFLLSSTPSDKYISWQWEHENIGLNVVKFELINKDDNVVLYSGLNTTYGQISPTKIHNNAVKVTYDNAVTRETRLITSAVYNNNTDKFSFGQLTTKDDKKSIASMKIEIYRDLLLSAMYKNTYFADNLKTFSNSNILYSDLKAFGSYRLSLINYRHDDYSFYQDSISNGSFKTYVEIKTHQTYSRNVGLKLSLNNNITDKYKINYDYFANNKSILSIKPLVFNSQSRVIQSKSVTYQDGKILNQPKYNIYNNRTSPFGLKLDYFNFMQTLVTRQRQTVFNPATSYDVNHVDVVFNTTITNVDLQSQVNKVRILCIGDSITAGAPSYDPQYGGTVWIADLITGKTKTRNVIESQYPYWLQKRLGIDDFEIINEGSGRRTSTEVEYHVRSQMEAYKPEYVIIMIGTNDIFQSQDSGITNLQNVVNTTLNNIRKTVDKVREFNGVPILGTQLPRNSIVPIEAKNALRNLNAGIKNLGIEYGIDIIDWYDEFVQKDNTGKENGVLRYDLTVDDTHPSVAGYKKMAYTINLGIFNSFRASLRLFGSMLGNDVDYSTEESKVQPDPYTFNYSIVLPELRRLQRYVFSKYIKNTGNSWGLFVIQLNDPDNICEIWDAKNKVWTNTLIGQLAPNQVMEFRMRYIMPSTGTKKQVDFNIDYIVKR
jgi:lysophospholipase L1-like esterase